jgi:acyl-CoA synthetase (AMP-forming)/AMP-acid ligase II
MVMTDADTRIFRSSLPFPAADRPLPVAAIEHAAAEPDRTALADGATGESVSRRELAERSAALAAGLAERGIVRGDVVALAMPNLAWWPVVALGVWRAGAVLATLNPAWTAGEMARVLAVVRPRLGVAWDAAAEPLSEALAEARIDADVVAHRQVGDGDPLEQLLVSGGDPFAVPEIGAGDLAALPFSSGLGGLPKGVRLTHGNLSASSALAVTGLGRDADSVELAAAPLCNAMGLVGSLCTALSVGAKIVTLPYPEPARILDLVAEHRVTSATIPPSVVEAIAGDPDAERHDTSSLESVITGGAHVRPETQLGASERLGAVVRQAYGMTEALTISASTRGASDPETVGWLAAGTEARLVDPHSGEDVDPGRPGELWVRGPQVMDGYYDDPAATAAMITVDGWLRTGDLVRIRDDGQVVIEDRLKPLIKVRGASVAPAELELVLRQHPAVVEAAVGRRPDDKRGEVPVAWVVPSGAVTSSELISFVDSRVARHKRLHDVRIVNQLPEVDR